MDDFVMQKLQPKTWQRSDSANWHVLKDIDGNEVLLPESFPEILLNKNDGSERLIPFIRTLVENPFEIWLRTLKNNSTGQVILVQIYIGLYRVEKVSEKLILVMKCDRMEGSWVASDLFEVTPEQGDLFRCGTLIYGKPDDNIVSTNRFDL